MIELRENSLQISFPEVHAEASMSVDFQRTLRIPDDGKTYPLPAGLGAFPCQHVDDHAQTVPTNWLERGGIMLPMYQSEAMWINFSGDYISDRETCYPFAMKIAAGKINAVTGKKHKNKLKKAPQDYVVVPEQPWLDGYCVEQGVIRQFVAMPLGDGYSAEEQITGEAEHGGLQIIVYPMKREVFEKRFPKIQRQEFRDEPMLRQPSMDWDCVCDAAPDMGLAPGGRMKQEIYDDPFDFSDWDQVNASRCFVHLANSLVWRQITGEEAPTVPPTSEEYANSDLPWFDYYSEATAVGGSETLNKLKSVATIGKQAGKNPLPENESVTVDDIQLIRRGLSEDEVRDSQF